MRWPDRLLAWLPAALALVGLALCAWELRADPHVVRWMNPDARPTDGTEVCVGTACYDVGVGCAPGAVCEATVDVPDGCWTVTVASRIGVQAAAGPVERRICVLDDVERYDRDGDGRVTTSDFGGFLRAFGAGR